MKIKFEELAKKIAKELNIDLKKISLQDFMAGLKIETEHDETIKADTPYSYNDWLTFGKITRDHLRESSKYYSNKVGLVNMEKRLETESLSLYNIMEAINPDDIEWNYASEEEMNPRNTNDDLCLHCANCGDEIYDDEDYWFNCTRCGAHFDVCCAECENAIADGHALDHMAAAH